MANRSNANRLNVWGSEVGDTLSAWMETGDVRERPSNQPPGKSDASASGGRRLAAPPAYPAALAYPAGPGASGWLGRAINATFEALGSNWLEDACEKIVKQSATASDRAAEVSRRLSKNKATCIR